MEELPYESPPPQDSNRWDVLITTVLVLAWIAMLLVVLFGIYIIWAIEAGRY